MTFKTITLGCKVNFYESNAIGDCLKNASFTVDDNKCDIVIINTCSVTAIADQKSRQIIRREKRNNPNAIIVVMGCYSQKNADYILENCNADIIIGTSYRNEVLSLINEFLNTRKPIIKINKSTRNLAYESFGVFPLPESTRAYVKIQDGCNNFCTYCTIPYTRGEARSKNKDEVISEITYLVEHGYKEIVLTGIHTAHYGLDLKNTTFSDLVEEILKIKDLYRLRISSIEESEIDDKLISLLNNEKLANHLHIPLQSGSPSILKRMNRRYDVSSFINKVEQIRKVRPDIAITTDVIVGFPGESEENFLETKNLIDKVKFAELHVFPFSSREGTAAYSFPDQIEGSIKSRRVNELIALSKKLEEEYKNKFKGQELEVILEERNKLTHKLSGFTSNYLKLSADLPDEYIGKIVKLKV